MSDYLQRASKKLDDLTDEEFIKIIDDVEKSAGWTPDVVYKVYCNDDLKTLPLGILEDMKTYIEQVILDKTKTCENERIIKLIQDRYQNDDGTRYTTEEIIEMRKGSKEQIS